MNENDERKFQGSNLPALAGEIDCIEREEEFFFSFEAVGRGLGYEEPLISMSKLFSAHRSELETHTLLIESINNSGGPQQKRHFTEEGVYIATFLSKAPKAAAFRAKVARLLKELRQRKLVLIEADSFQRGLLEGKDRMAEVFAAALEELNPARLETIRRVARYRKLGLEKWEIEKLLDLKWSRIKDYQTMARRLGLLPRSNHDTSRRPGVGRLAQLARQEVRHEG